VGVGVGAPVLILIVGVIVFVARRKSGKSKVELIRVDTERKQIPTPRNRVVPTSESVADEEGGRTTTMGNLKADNGTVSSTSMLTLPDFTNDESKAESKFTSGGPSQPTPSKAFGPANQ
jgi:hypothetical protein